jgi:hypothetical protein
MPFIVPYYAIEAIHNAHETRPYSKRPLIAHKKDLDNSKLLLSKSETGITRREALKIYNRIFNIFFTHIIKLKIKIINF